MRSWNLLYFILLIVYSKTCPEQSLKTNTKIGFQDQLLLNKGQTYCRMLQWEHSAILLTFIKLPFVIKTFVLSIFEWPLKTDFNVHVYSNLSICYWLLWIKSKFPSDPFNL